MIEVVFTKPFSKTITGNAPAGSVGGFSGTKTFSYKIGDKVSGTHFPEGKYVVVMPFPNVFINIPDEYFKKDTSDITPYTEPAPTATPTEPPKPQTRRLETNLFKAGIPFKEKKVIGMNAPTFVGIFVVVLIGVVIWQIKPIKKFLKIK